MVQRTLLPYQSLHCCKECCLFGARNIKKYTQLKNYMEYIAGLILLCTISSCIIKVFQCTFNALSLLRMLVIAAAVLQQPNSVTTAFRDMEAFLITDILKWIKINRQIYHKYAPIIQRQEAKLYIETIHPSILMGQVHFWQAKYLVRRTGKNERRRKI